MITTVTKAAITMQQYLLKLIKKIIRDGHRFFTTPKTELSLVKVSHFEVLPVATKKSHPGVGGIQKKSHPGVGGILDATLMYSV